MTTFVNDMITGGEGLLRMEQAIFLRHDMRVMGDLTSWFAGIRPIDRTPAVVDV